MNILLSECIKASRFPMALIIVSEHYYANEVVCDATRGGDLYHKFGLFSNEYFPEFVVPLFFFISGYLFWVNIDIPSIGINNMFSVYIDKIKKRIKTLVIPYISWNFIVLSGLLFVQFISEDQIKPLSTSLKDFTYVDIFKSFWSITEGGNPVDAPLWFIRDLFVICLLSPLIGVWIRGLKVYGFLIIVLLYCLVGELSPFPPSFSCYFFFMLGGYFSYFKINGKDYLEVVTNVKLKYSLFSYLVVLMIFVFTVVDSCQYLFLKRFYSLISVLTIWPILKYVINRFKDNIIYKQNIDILSKSSFFIFAIHYPLMYVLCLLVFKLINPTNELFLMSLIVLVPLITYLISLVFYYILFKFFPFMKFLNGYRI